MSIEEAKTIDFLSVEPASGNVKLTISDHLPWSEDPSHLLLLQDKLNAYLQFIENGDLLRQFPEAQGRQVVIEIVHKFKPNNAGRSFIDKCRTVTSGLGVQLNLKLGPQIEN